MTIYHHSFFPKTPSLLREHINTEYCIQTHYLSVSRGMYIQMRQPHVIKTKDLNVGLSTGLGIPLNMG